MSESIQGKILKYQEKGVARKDVLCRSSTKLYEIDAERAALLDAYSHIYHDREIRTRHLRRSISAGRLASSISLGRSMSTGNIYALTVTQKPSRKQKKLMKATLRKIKNGLITRRQNESSTGYW
mmetsp:Transcript_342/g.586  ORF Transcript_342/g.586 Transcript_342/m.586 type:complete len:124 (-) Transcript_342:305-676(-)